MKIESTRQRFKYIFESLQDDLGEYIYLIFKHMDGSCREINELDEKYSNLKFENFRQSLQNDGIKKLFKNGSKYINNCIDSNNSISKIYNII
jgi:hypothetical protein